MHAALAPLQAGPDAVTVVVGLPAVVLGFFAVVAYAQHRMDARLVADGHLDPEVARELSDAAILGGAVLLVALGAGVLATLVLRVVLGPAVWLWLPLVFAGVGLGTFWALRREAVTAEEEAADAGGGPASDPEDAPAADDGDGATPAADD